MADPQSTKIIQAILNGQNALEERLTKKIDKIVDEKVESLKTELKTEIKGAEKRLTKRIDSLGKSLAYLEDDAPTRDEHEKLVKRVDRIEQKVIPQA